MEIDSIKRLLVLLFGTAVLYAGHKLGLSDGTLTMITGLFATYLAQSGAKAIAGEMAKHQALATIASEALKIKAAFDDAKASQAKDTGSAAAAAPGSPSQA